MKMLRTERCHCYQGPPESKLMVGFATLDNREMDGSFPLQTDFLELP